MAAHLAVRDGEGSPVRRFATPGRDSTGAATPVVVSIIAVIVSVALVVVAAGAAVLTQVKTSSAADLAALAAARVDRDLRAQGVAPRDALVGACSEARSIASLNGGTVVGCVRGKASSVVVTVETHVNAWPRPVSASARAGPSWG